MRRFPLTMANSSAFQPGTGVAPPNVTKHLRRWIPSARSGLLPRRKRRNGRLGREINLKMSIKGHCGIDSACASGPEIR
jgi:hypothetical protein